MQYVVVPYIAITNKTVVNSTAETTLLPTGTGNANGSLVFPSYYLNVAKTFRIYACGFHSTVSNATIDIKIKLNNTIILDTGVVPSGNGTNDFWEVRAVFTCRSTGTTGTLFSQGFYFEGGGGGNNFPMVNIAANTIDTTIPQTLDMTAQWGTQSNSDTITMTNAFIEVLYTP